MFQHYSTNSEQAMVWWAISYYLTNFEQVDLHWRASFSFSDWLINWQINLIILRQIVDLKFSLLILYFPVLLITNYKQFKRNSRKRNTTKLMEFIKLAANKFALLSCTFQQYKNKTERHISLFDLGLSLKICEVLWGLSSLGF